MHSGKFNSTQYWKLTSSFVKRIFAEVGYARVSTSNAVDIYDPWTSGYGVLFSTLRDNSVMS